MMKSVVKSIGKEAISPKEPLLILFGEGATEELKKHSIIQSFEEKNPEEVLKVGSKIKFDKQEYTITKVGPVANNYLQSMGHVTVVFKEVPKEDSLANSLYVTPTVLPKIQVGTIITYDE